MPTADPTATLRAKTVGIGSPIDADRVYSLKQFKAATSLSGYYLRRAERQGLVIDKFGTFKFIRGAEWIRFLAARAER